MSSPNFRHWYSIAMLLASCTAAAQDEDLTLPPRIIDVAPTQARLATPDDAGREDAMEEVLVIRENPWRLPDLGSEWRARHEAEARPGRITADLLPLFDPEAEQPTRDLFPLNREMQRVGFIEIFRIRFGDR